jgi:hypothetical protein
MGQRPLDLALGRSRHRRYLRNSAELAKRTAPSRSRLSKSSCFNAGIMSRARKQAVCGILQVPQSEFRIERAWG